MNRSTSAFSLRVILCLLFLFLFGALFRLQVIKGSYYRRIAENNFVRIRRVTATRGEIYDVKYRPIVINIPSHDLYLISGKVENIDALSVFLKTNFGIEKEELHDLIFQQRFKTYEEIMLVDNISYETMLTLSEKLNYFPELVFRSGTTREYLYPNHFTGYVGRINEDEFKRYRQEDYSLNGYIGKGGLEKYYEILLRGRDGKQILQVDARGQSLGFFRTDTDVAPINGLSLVLSIDNDLQTFVQECFPHGSRGAIVVSNIEDGGILAYASNPSYDPNVFMQRISPDLWAELNRPERPLLDRVSQGAYPPGSVFKPVTAAEGLEAGIINRSTLLASCGGGLKIGNRFFKCWSSAGHGRTNVVDALRVSCDVFFYDLISRISLDDAWRHAVSCGVVNRTGIDIPGERAGLYPNTEWFKKRLGRAGSLQGYKANLSIGQGEVLTTPLQMNALYAAIARGGYWIQPHFLVRTLGRGKVSREQVQPLDKHSFGWSQSTVKAIQDGLWAVTNAPGGTGRAFNVAGVTTYGKTGSAENAMGKVTHAWFCGYIVTEKPEIAITVFLENAGGGGAVAAPIASRIANYYVGNIDRFKAPAAIPDQFRDLEGEDEDEAEEVFPLPMPLEEPSAVTPNEETG